LIDWQQPISCRCGVGRKSLRILTLQPGPLSAPVTKTSIDLQAVRKERVLTTNATAARIFQEIRMTIKPRQPAPALNVDTVGGGTW